MREPPRPESERARREAQVLVADPHAELAVEHVEPLVLFVMDVPRRAFAGTHRDLHHAERAARCGAADLHDLEHAEEPVRVTFARVEQISVATLRRNNRHLILPSLGLGTVKNCLVANSSITNYPRRNNPCQVHPQSGCARGVSTSKARWR